MSKWWRSLPLRFGPAQLRRRSLQVDTNSANTRASATRTAICPVGPTAAYSQRSLPLRRILPPGRPQRNVLHHARLGALVRAAGVRQRLMPKHQIPSLTGNRHQPRMAQDCLAGILRRRQLPQPLIQRAVKSGNAAESSLIGRCIGEVENALHPEAVGPRQRRIPVHMRPRKLPAVAR
jgi:hypothetical protein